MNVFLFKRYVLATLLCSSMAMGMESPWGEQWRSATTVNSDWGFIENDFLDNRTEIIKCISKDELIKGFETCSAIKEDGTGLRGPYTVQDSLETRGGEVPEDLLWKGFYNSIVLREDGLLMSDDVVEAFLKLEVKGRPFIDQGFINEWLPKMNECARDLLETKFYLYGFKEKKSIFVDQFEYFWNAHKSLNKFVYTHQNLISFIPNESVADEEFEKAIQQTEIWIRAFDFPGRHTVPGANLHAQYDKEEGKKDLKNALFGLEILMGHHESQFFKGETVPAYSVNGNSLNLGFQIDTGYTTQQLFVLFINMIRKSEITPSEFVENFLKRTYGGQTSFPSLSQDFKKHWKSNEWMCSEIGLPTDFYAEGRREGLINFVLEDLNGTDDRYVELRDLWKKTGSHRFEKGLNILMDHLIMNSTGNSERNENGSYKPRCSYGVYLDLINRIFEFSGDFEECLPIPTDCNPNH